MLKRTRVPFSVAVLVLGLCTSFSALSQTTQSRSTGIALNNDAPIQIESDKLEIFEKKRQAVFIGNVNVRQENTQLKAGKLIVYYADGNGSVAGGAADIERIVLQNRVFVKSKDQVATADSGSFNMASEVLELVGKPIVLTEGASVMKGCRLTVLMRNGEAKLESCPEEGGRVTIQLDPKSRSGN